MSDYDFDDVIVLDSGCFNLQLDQEKEKNNSGFLILPELEIHFF